MKRALIALTAVLLAGCGGSSTHSSPRRFSARVTNPWYPLLPGSVYVYRGVKDGEPSREVMTVTPRTRSIHGAPCVVVSDLPYLKRHQEERTPDYYTQDSQSRRRHL